jgi:hypothetical protein
MNTCDTTFERAHSHEFQMLNLLPVLDTFTFFDFMNTRPNETTRPLFVDFYYFLVKKGKRFKLYVRIHTIARSKEHIHVSSE